MEKVVPDRHPPDLPPTPPPHPAVAPLSVHEERQWSLFAHLSGLLGYLGLPFGSVFGPLVIWLVKRDRSALVDENGREALNFHLSMLLYALISLPLALVFVGFLTLLAIPIVEIVFTIIGALKASEGECYRYPLTIRFVT